MSLNALHDEVDYREDLRDRAREIVARVIKDKFDQVFDSAKEFGPALTILAALIENELADITTEAVKMGAKLAIMRIDAMS